VAVNLEGRSTATKMVGVDVAMPVALAPTGLAGMQHADGEILAAKAANCGALMLTLDPQILGQRHKDLKNGLSAPPRLTIPNIVNMMTKPRWCLGMLGTRRRQFGNIVGHVKGVGDMGSLSDWTAASAPVRTC
jgi:L-lactate dehydrogenase (cytochrome)